MTTTILQVLTKHGDKGCWLILACGHWYHWTGAIHPKADTEIECPGCSLTTVVKP